MAALVLLAAAPAAAGASSSVDYGPISHKGFKTVGAASTSLKLPLQIGLIANQSGLQKRGQVREQPGVVVLRQVPVAVDAAEQVRRLVVEAQGGRQRVQVRRDHGEGRRHAPARERDGQRRQGAEDVRDQVEGLQDPSGSKVALPVNTPKLPKRDQGQRRHGRRDAPAAQLGRQLVGRAGRGSPRRDADADRDAGVRLRADDLPRRARLRRRPVPEPDPDGIRDRPAAGRRAEGPGRRLAIVGEAPTPASDVNTFRYCFGAQGTALKIHNAGCIKPILESSLDAMTASMVAPALSRFDLWVHPISESDDDGDVEGFLALLAQPLQATTNGTPLPARDLGLLRRVRVDREAVHRVAHAGRAPTHRHRGARASRPSSRPATAARRRARAASRPTS